MKIAIIADTHYGIRSDSIHFLNSMGKFMNEVFFPYLNKENIRTIIHLGDLVDRRKYINFYTASKLRQDFIDNLLRYNINAHIILGNHDIYYRNTLAVNAITELLSQYNNIKYYTEPTEIQPTEEFLYEKMLFVPWICDENKEKTYQLIKTTDAKILMGHLELAGFEMHKGQYNNVGEDPLLFRKFEICFSGHYHHKSTYANISYLGAAGQYSWSDYNDPRGFHIFDIKNKELQFIQNPFTMFEKIYYEDDVEYDEEDLKLLKDKYVKIVVKTKNDFRAFDEFLARLENYEPYDITIVDDHLNNDLISDTDIETETKDTLTIFKEYIEQSNTFIDSKKLDIFMTDLYKEALNTQ